MDLKELFRVPDFKGDVVLTVAGRPASRAELEHQLRQMQIQLTAAGLPPGLDRQRVLRGAADRLIDAKMLAVLADELGAKADPGYEKRWLADLEKRMEAQPTFKRFLLTAGKDKKQRALDAKQAALRQGVMDKLRVQVKGDTEAKAKAYYDSHLKDFTERAGTETWRIYVKAPRGMVQRDRDIARGRAEGILEKVKKNPKNFKNIAISNSEGGKASTGGFVGWVGPGTLAPDLEKQIFAAKPNTILPLWEDASGFYVYKIGRSREAKTLPFEAVADAILNKVYRRTINDKIQNELARLKGEKTVEILVDEMNKG